MRGKTEMGKEQSSIYPWTASEIEELINAVYATPHRALTEKERENVLSILRWFKANRVTA